MTLDSPLAFWASAFFLDLRSPTSRARVDGRRPLKMKASCSPNEVWSSNLLINRKVGLRRNRNAIFIFGLRPSIARAREELWSKTNQHIPERIPPKVGHQSIRFSLLVEDQ